jgi:hypothetical protein
MRRGIKGWAGPQFVAGLTRAPLPAAKLDQDYQDITGVACASTLNIAYSMPSPSVADRNKT